MQTLGMILMIAGYVIAGVGGIWLLVVAFRTSIGWGLGCLLFNPVAIVFVIMHWSDAGKPFLVEIGGVVLIVVGALIGAAAAA